MRKIVYIVISIISILGGVLFFAVTHNIIIVRIPYQNSSSFTHNTLKKEHMRFTYWKGTNPVHEWRYIIEGEDDIVTAQRIITAYWAILEDNSLLTTRIHVQATSLDRTGKILLCSLSQNPCSTETSTRDVWLIIEGLIVTLRELMPQFQKILFLVNHEPLVHPRLDFSRPWPLEGFSSCSQLSDNYTKPPHMSNISPLDRSLTVYINPAGSAYHPGRTIGDSFERGTAINCALALKDELAVRLPLTRVVVNHIREEHRDLFQSINQANRVRANVYLHLSFYQTQATTPELTLITFRWNPTTDLWKREIRRNVFIPFHEAHLATAHITSTMAHHMFYYAITTRPFPLVASANLALPYVPLAGIAIPAIGIEIGINDTKQLAEIAPAIADLITKGLEALP